MRLGKKTRAGITLTLGALVGLGLLVLPGVLAPPTSNSISTSSDTRASSSAFTAGSGSQRDQPTQTPTSSLGSSLAILVGLVLPAIATSLFVRHLVLKRAENRLGSRIQ